MKTITKHFWILILTLSLTSYYSQGQIKPPPESPFTATQNWAHTILELNWGVPNTNLTVLGYNVYLNNVLIAFSPTNSLVDGNLWPQLPCGLYHWEVKAVYDSGYSTGIFSNYLEKCGIANVTVNVTLNCYPEIQNGLTVKLVNTLIPDSSYTQTVNPPGTVVFNYVWIGNGNTPYLLTIYSGQNIVYTQTLLLSGDLTVDTTISIPTLSQWGLIILGLLFLAAEMVYLRRRKYSFAMAGGAEVSEGRKNLINRRDYFIILALLLGIAMVVFTTLIIFSIAVPVMDIAGALISSVILAYILHLLIPFRKK
jgi:hypothetical protein